VILPDTNLLIYATNPRFPQHEKARAWWDSCLNGNEGVGLSWQVLLAYCRLMSSGRIQPRPVPVGELLDDVEVWLTSPMVRMVDPSSHHTQAMRSIVHPTALIGDQLNDVHLAALSIEYGAVVHTADRDFARFRAVRWFNPLA
jgi:toxin-antitoxin system PIN domain toxin